MRRAALIAALLLSANALAQQKKLQIAIYAPNAPFASGTERFNFVTRLAQQITSVAGVQAEGKAFARAGDFERAIAAKQVDFAVVDGIYLAMKGVPYSVMAIATSGGETAPKWAVFAASESSFKELQGKKLVVASTGSRDDDFIGNAIFDGELQVKRFFGPKSTAPDIASAVSAVSLKKADAVVAPESEGKGMKAVFDAGRIPNPAFCQISNGISSDIVAKVKSAVLSHSVSAALDGWKAGEAGTYRALAGRMSARSRRPLMAEPDVVKLGDSDILVPPQLEAAQPDLKSQYWTPQ
jgi:ABC-type amino acid transport substrate-binding protein